MAVTVTAGRHLGFTGTRAGPTIAQRHTLRDVLARLAGEGFAWLHHGDCVGSDAAAHDLARAVGLVPVIHPPTDPALRAWCLGGAVEPARPYLQRDRDIVAASELLVATPGGGRPGARSGTWYTVQHAERRGVEVTLVWPDGRVSASR